MRNLMTGCLLAAFLCAASCGCSKDNGGGEEGGQVAGVTVKPAYNKSEVLHNPLNGWVMYVSADYDPSYFDKEIYVPLLGKNVRVADYASACYIRTKWSVLNPADGPRFEGLQTGSESPGAETPHRFPRRGGRT